MRRPSVLVATVVVLVVLAVADVALTVLALVARLPALGDLVWIVVETVTRVSLLAALGVGWWRGRPAERPVAALLGVLALILIPVVLGVRDPLSGPALASVAGEVALVAVLLVLVTRPRMRVLWPEPVERSAAEQAWSERRAERVGMPWWRRVRQALLDDRDARGGIESGR